MKKIIAILLVMLILLALPIMAMAETATPASTIDLTPLLQALIGVLATIITVKVLPWIKARTTAQQQAMLSAVTRTLVYAAEQIYGSGTGKQKLQYVRARLLEKGYAVDLDAIEAAVREMTMESGVEFIGMEAEVEKPPDGVVQPLIKPPDAQG